MTEQDRTEQDKTGQNEIEWDRMERDQEAHLRHTKQVKHHGIESMR